MEEFFKPSDFSNITTAWGCLTDYQEQLVAKRANEKRDEALESAKANIINLMAELKIATGTRLNKGARKDAAVWLGKYGNDKVIVAK